MVRSGRSERVPEFLTDRPELVEAIRQALESGEPVTAGEPDGSRSVVLILRHWSPAEYEILEEAVDGILAARAKAEFVEAGRPAIPWKEARRGLG